MNAFRTESDLLGELQIPENAYYGVQTQRALENFRISNHKLCHYPVFIKSLAAVKLAAIEANFELGLIDENIKNAVSEACAALLNGEYSEQFPIDMIQGGAGTSVNMNANEVIANIALEKMGHPKGAYQYCSPNDHINRSQSTNDAYPTALKLALFQSSKKLTDALEKLFFALDRKAKEFEEVIKMGRTQLQDAVPMTLGQEFDAFAFTLKKEIPYLQSQAYQFLEINMGATAIGTGINAPTGYAEICTEKLATLMHEPVKLAENLIEATSDTSSFVAYASALKKMALKLSKVCNDLRLLSSGPRAGFNEINLPAVQAGSSIMPGKVNPVIPEVVSQVAFEVIGNDVAVTMAVEAGQMQLNAFEPIIAHSLFKSAKHLGAACITLADNCVKGITANTEQLCNTVNNSIGIVTALNPYIGYANATEVAQAAHQNGTSVYDEVLQRELMTREQLETVLKPEILTCPAPLNI